MHTWKVKHIYSCSKHYLRACNRNLNPPKRDALCLFSLCIILKKIASIIVQNTYYEIGRARQSWCKTRDPNDKAIANKVFTHSGSFVSM